MTKLEQAARQLLDEIDTSNPPTVREKTITAMREALAEQAEQEPVAWMDGMGRFHKYRLQRDWIPLYAAPVRTKDLTDDEILKTNKTELPDCQDLVDFARAVIEKFKEKNK